MGWVKSLFSSKTASDETHPLIKAIGDQHEVTMLYRGRQDFPDQQLEPRTVIPTRINESNGHVVAFDTGKQAWRQFFPGQTRGPNGTVGVEKVISTTPSRMSHEELLSKFPEEEKPQRSRPAPQPARPAQPAQPAGPRARVMVGPDDTPSQAAAPATLPPAPYLVPGGTPWADKDDKRWEREYAVNPTPEEHEEMWKADANIFKSGNPDRPIKASYDKATYKRVRNLGATHAQCLEVASEGIPLEEYEDGLKNNPGDHSKAKQTALGYLDHYKGLIAKNQLSFDDNYQKREALQDKEVLSPEDHTRLLAEVVEHHLALKNAPEERLKGRWSKTPWRRRANEWCISECNRVEPKFKKFKSDTETFNEKAVMSPKDYDDRINLLLRHHTLKHLNARTLPEFIASKRKLTALGNLSESKFLPTPYTHDKYEE